MSSSGVHSSIQLYLDQINLTALLTPARERELARLIRTGNCLEARDEMIRANLRLVVAIAKRYARCGLPLGDLIEEGNLGLMRAVESYDPDRGARFSTYASWWIKQSIRRAMVGVIQPVRVPPYMVELIGRWKRTTRELTERLGRSPTLPEVAEAMQVPLKKLRAVRAAARAAQRSNVGPAADGEHASNAPEVLTDDRTPAPGAAAALRDDVDALHRFLQVIDRREAEILRLRYGLHGGPPLTLKQIGQQIGLTRERVRQLEGQTLHRLQALLESDRPDPAFRPLRASA